MPSPNSFGQLGLSILGLGTQYPPYALKPDAVDTLAKRFHNVDSPSMKKVLSINQYTGIDVRDRPTCSRRNARPATDFSSRAAHRLAILIIL